MLTVQLKDGSDESKKQAARPFVNRGLAHERHGVRARCDRLFAEAGRKEPYRFYLPLLDIQQTELPLKTEKGDDPGISYFEEPVRELFAKEIVVVFGKEKDVAAIARMHLTADRDAEVRAVSRDFWAACRALPLSPYVEAWEVRSPEMPRPLLFWCADMAQSHRDSMQDATMEWVKLLP